MNIEFTFMIYNITDKIIYSVNILMHDTCIHSQINVLKVIDFKTWQSTAIQNIFQISYLTNEFVCVLIYIFNI